MRILSSTLATLKASRPLSSGVAIWIEPLSTNYWPERKLQPPNDNVDLLAASRFVLSPDFPEVHHGRSQHRADSANALRYAAEKDNLRSLPFLPNDTAKRQAVESFSEWFKKAEPSLQSNADKDRGLIESAYAQMAMATTCR
jgi:hypothetical protein